MQIYTGTGSGPDDDVYIDRYGLGIMISAEPAKKYTKLPCAIDNGAYMAAKRGLPWSPDRYMRLLDRCWDAGISPDFVVLPDVPFQGRASLELSAEWLASGKLRPARLALAVQDGMTIAEILRLGSHFEEVSVIFLGGSLDFKLREAALWCNFAHEHGKKFHYARCGTLQALCFAKSIGADSCDSTSWVRNGTWEIIEEFMAPNQTNIFNQEKK